jgi:hypothetical protein
MLIKENDSMLVLSVDSFIVPYSILGEKTTFRLGSHAWYMMLKPKLMFDGLDSSIYECSLLLLYCVLKNIEFTCLSANFCVYIPSDLQDGSVIFEKHEYLCMLVLSYCSWHLPPY